MPGFRGAKRSAGLGHAHTLARREWAGYLQEAGSLPCTRCRRPVYPGTDWHLDHHDDRQTYRGVAHARCNRRAGAQLGAQRAAAAKAAREARGVSRLVW